MTESAAEENALWKDVLLTSCEETSTDTLTTIDDDDDGSVRKKALDLARACYMFTAVLMRPTGVQYHVNLAQNILSATLHNEVLKNELYAHLVKLTSGSMPYALQVYIVVLLFKKITNRR
ncbi:hypothetical protein AB6A40_001350 [Gnathostoma spinigerum]|uniref:Uncharacterized protein n=1 Tax=Gnathostoma spinigerum TaxID=75299 RepID=A0ABD6E675_9BILA